MGLENHFSQSAAIVAEMVRTESVSFRDVMAALPEAIKTTMVSPMARPKQG
jgi:hypothetical protein